MTEWENVPVAEMTIGDVLTLIVVAGIVYLVARWLS